MTFEEFYSNEKELLEKLLNTNDEGLEPLTLAAIKIVSDITLGILKTYHQEVLLSLLPPSDES